MMRKDQISRREFLKLSALALGGLAIRGSGLGKILSEGSQLLQPESTLPDFPVNQQLGRICVGEPGTRIPIRSEPYIDAPTVGSAWFDDVFVWKQEVIAKHLDRLRINQRWVETPEGYIYADDMQRVRHIPQEPLAELPEMPDGSRGMWVEITTPYIDIDLTKPKETYQFWVKIHM